MQTFPLGLIALTSIILCTLSSYGSVCYLQSITRNFSDESCMMLVQDFIKSLSVAKFKSWQQISIQYSHFSWFSENSSNYSLTNKQHKLHWQSWISISTKNQCDRHTREKVQSDWAMVSFISQPLKCYIIFPCPISHMTHAVLVTEEININIIPVSWVWGIWSLLSKVQK